MPKREEAKIPGDALTSPYGDGKGATQAAGPYSGAHDFIAKPGDNAPKTGGRDFTKENREQPKGDQRAPDLCVESIPEGGTLPFKGAPQAVSRTPFKGLK